MSGWVEGTPNPGSVEAVAAGCRCPQRVNNYGRELDGQVGWHVGEECPLHSPFAVSSHVKAYQ